MISIGKKVDIANLGEMGIISRTMDEQDCAIVISYSGNNKHAEPMSYLQNLLDQKVSIIGITSGGDNYMRRILPCVFTMSSKERLYTKIANLRLKNHYNLSLMYYIPVTIVKNIKRIVYLKSRVLRFWNHAEMLF